LKSSGRERKRSAESGAGLLEALVAAAILGFVAFGIAMALGKMADSSKIIGSSTRATGMVDILDAFIELRLVQFFFPGTAGCNNYPSGLDSAFVAAVLASENLVLELGTAATMAPPPASMTGSSAAFLAAWDRCVLPLPATEADFQMNFCVNVKRANTTDPFTHVAAIEPSFAEVQVTLHRIVDNTTVNCTQFDRATVPARIMDIRYTLHWIERVGANLMAMSTRVRFMGSPDRGVTP